MGNHEALLEASHFIETIEKRQGFKNNLSDNQQIRPFNSSKLDRLVNLEHLK
jgi:hypothetical protein